MSAKSEPGSQDRQAPHRTRTIIIGVAKWVIAAAVAVGLYHAAQSAAAQWRAESDKLRDQIAAIELEVSASQDPVRRGALQRTRARLQSSAPRLSNLRWQRIGLASLLYGLGLIPPCFVLRRASLALGQHPRLSTAIAAQLIGHVGKYVPGKAMVVILRAGVLSRDDVTPTPAMIAVFLETFLMMAVGAAVAGIVILWLPAPSWITMTAIAMAALAGLPTLPPVLKRVAAIAMRKRRADFDAQIGVGLFAAGWCWSLLTWLLIGASFTTLITAIPAATALPSWIELYPLATAAISLAMVVGFASLLPGGAGVRELILATILGLSIGSSHGLLAAIAARLMFIAVEAAVAGVAWLWLRKSHQSDAISIY